jgi:hypothetical protein
MAEKGEILNRICEALLAGDSQLASTIATREYAHENLGFAGRKYSEFESTKIFLRDGFLDRYSGTKLVFPAALRLISRLMPAEFPAHPNWKMSESHIVYWELFPTIDHVIPVARGGPDEESNWVTTSMIRNSAKSNWLLEELGWHLQPVGNFREWDGLIGWFMKYIEKDPIHLNDPYLKRWHKAASRVLDTISFG